MDDHLKKAEMKIVYDYNVKFFYNNSLPFGVTKNESFEVSFFPQIHSILLLNKF